MASTELISSRGAPKKSRYTFGKALGDYGKVMANTAMSGLGMNLAFDEFEGDWAEKLSGILSPMAGMVRDTGMTAATMGTGIPVGPGMFATGGPKGKSLYQTDKRAFVDSTLNANQDKEWVDRLYPSIFNPSKSIKNIIPNTRSTHMMGHDGQGYVYPHIVKEGKDLMYMQSDDQAGDYARQNNSGIQFKTPEQAAWFAEDGYKQGTGVFNRNLAPSKVYAQGGLTRFEGPSHAEGGIQVGKDEVEGSETSMPMGEDQDFIFSEQINVPGTKSSFAKKSKSIESKYIRPNDPYEKKSMMAELGKLAKLQEAVKMFDGMQPEYDTKMTKKGMLVTPAKKMSFDKAAKKSGVSMDELAEGMLAEAQQAQEQEQMQGQEMMPQEGMEGQQFWAGGVWDPPTYEDYLIQQGENTPTMFDKPESLLSTNRGTKQPFRMNPISKPITGDITSNPNAWKAGEQVAPTLKGVSAKDSGGYESNFMIPALGYAAQALTNIPGLLAKPNYQNSPKVKFDDISLAEERNEARRSRNLGYATAQSMGGNDMGQTMNFMAGTTAALNSAYGQEFNRSLMQEEQANADINMREQMANSQIGMADADINARERDSAQALRMNALSNIGKVAATAGGDYLKMQQFEDQLSAYGDANPYYDFENRRIIPKIINGKRAWEFEDTGEPAPPPKEGVKALGGLRYKKRKGIK